MTKVELVKQYSNNGRYIRLATKVTIDGRSVEFTERLPKGVAIKQAKSIIAK